MLGDVCVWYLFEDEGEDCDDEVLVDKGVGCCGDV